MGTRWKRKCKFCGDHFFSERNTAKFCPDKPCRTKWHRERKRTVETPLQQTLDAIRIIGRAIEGDHSYEVVEALKSIAIHLDFYDITDAGTWWRCKKCLQTVTTPLPDKEGCTNNGVHEWHYQRRLF